MLFAAFVALGAGAATLRIATPLVSVGGDEAERFLDDQLVRAIAAAEATYPGLRAAYDGFQRSVDAPGSDIAVQVIAADSDGETMLVFNGTGAGGASESFVYRMPWHDALYRELAALLGYLHAVLGGRSVPEEGPLVFFQEFHTDFIATGDLPPGFTVIPYSLATRDGNLLVASGTFVLETDRYFREQAKVGLGAEVSGFWAMHVGATPAGTIAAASAGQGGVVRLVPGIPQPFRLPTRQAVSSLVAASDGGVYTLDLQQTFLRFSDAGASRINLGLPTGTFISFIAAGPENTLLVWEPTQRAVLIYDAEGTRIELIAPHVSFDLAIGLKHFEAYPNGDLLMVFADRFVRVARDGQIRWEVLANDIPEIGGLATTTEFHLAPDGTLYLLNINERRIVQLIDLEMIEDARGLTDTEQSILRSNERLRANPFDQRALAERARILEGVGAWEAAAFTWETAYGINPGNREIAEARGEVALARLDENARRTATQALRLLDEFGTASAASAYQRALQLHEQLLREDPGNASARERVESLRRRYEDAQTPQSAPPLRFEDVAIPDLFPSLFARYQSGAAGVVTVRNDGDRELTDVRLTTAMRFLDFATPGGAVESLAPGESVELEVRLPISAGTLQLQESTPVPVSVTVSYRVGSRAVEDSEVAIVTVHRATALTWDDSAKLAAYVTPRDGVVERWASPFVGIGEAERFGISEKLFRAARISDALGASGLEYVEDPQSGITQVLGNPTIVDTVRFPRTTMRVGYGDCDDTTALLSSLLESVGIATAIMTSPGHVFLAFDTGEPEQNAWLFESDRTTALRHDGTVWIPYETTIMDQGFLASWEEGSRLVRRYRDSGEIEFIPIGEARGRFAALPLDEASFEITPPPPALVAPRFSQSVASLRETLYLDSLAELESDVASQRGRARARTLNQIGILHGQFAEPTRAERTFRSAVEADPDYVATYINLANLAILTGNPSEALDWLDEADALRPDSVLVTLLRAQAQFAAGNRREAAEQMTILESRAPDLAARYPHLAGQAAGRASEAQTQPMLPWAVE